jgi:ATP-dependent protease ClpP protease subunit
MPAPMSATFPASARLFSPHIRLFGEVDDDMFCRFREQLDAAHDDHITLELTTPGGDADCGRRIADDIRIACEHDGKTFWFAGRTTVYSAGASIMSAFPRERRYLSRGCIVMVHQRKMDKDITFHSALQASEQEARQLIAQIDTGQMLEEKGFRALIDGSEISYEEMAERAATNWYLTAEEALDRKLIAGLF